MSSLSLKSLFFGLTVHKRVVNPKILQLFFRISRSDKRILAEMDLASSKKYLNMMLLGYGTGLEFLELFLDTLHSDFKTIISKLTH